MRYYPASSVYPGPVRPQSSAVTGLEWDGNQMASGWKRRMLYWSNPFAIYPATYIFKAYPKGPKTWYAAPMQFHWTMFFWGNNGNFAWDSGDGNTYYGAHPYPFGAQQDVSYGTQEWEISVASNDYPPPDPYDVEIDWNQWFTQVFIAWRESSTLTHHRFYWDFERDQSKVLEVDLDDVNWADTNPPTPCICVGQAPDLQGVGASSGQSWGGYAGYEEYKGILRGMQFYNQQLTLGQVSNELASPGSAVTPWYLKINPTPTDTADESGSGHHPSWDGSDRPTLWQG